MTVLDLPRAVFWSTSSPRHSVACASSLWRRLHRRCLRRQPVVLMQHHLHHHSRDSSLLVNASYPRFLPRFYDSVASRCSSPDTTAHLDFCHKTLTPLPDSFASSLTYNCTFAYFTLHLADKSCQPVVLPIDVCDIPGNLGNSTSSWYLECHINPSSNGPTTR